MKTRKWERNGAETALLGFGCMRFPITAEGTIDEELAQEMLDKAMAAGVNYYDTAYRYHDGDSEPFVGKALKKYDRASFYLATKLPCWMVNSLEDAERIFKDQLERLQTDYIDFYLLHALGKASWDKMRDMGVVEYCVRLKEEGKIKNLGFSFHDSYEVFEEIIRYHNWDFCQIQYNYMDTDEQAGDKGYALTEELGIPLVIMEPVRGGCLAEFSEDINARFKAMDPDASIASWALRWVGSHENVKVVLSGMSTEEQVADNLQTFADFMPLSEEEMLKIAQIAEDLKKRVKNGCTGCRYCMPCPAGVNIPANFSAWNQYHVYGTYNSAVKWKWEGVMKESEHAKNCIKCGKCEGLCPQKISIRADLEKAQADLEAACSAQKG